MIRIPGNLIKIASKKFGPSFYDKITIMKAKRANLLAIFYVKC